VTVQDPQTASRQFFDSMNAGDFDSMLAVVAADAVAHEPVGAPPLEGHAAMRSFYEGLGAAFEEMTIDVDAIYSAGGSNAIRWLGRGTTKAGANIAFEGIDVHELNEDGKIQSIRAYFDIGLLMSAMQA